jgi:hypothetical protein
LVEREALPLSRKSLSRADAANVVYLTCSEGIPSAATLPIEIE